ncbi:phage tail protein [Rahnella sp. C60]|uniref:phage tail assembly chaperone n=1 Tax=Rahnella perminowiae TaxID=2816244 RepID=UPI001C26B9AB|nr:phage tail assembly chaperone [Rahnella perminowiae]MBU9815498.1 phage tail protein [Rahnella perminowiae]
MSKPVFSLRDLALAPLSGFRKKVVTVPEWGNASVTIREPSSKGWIEWQQIISPEVPEGQEPVKLTPAQTVHRNMQADVVLFIDVLLDDKDQPVFSEEDRALVEGIYGPVHSRLLKQALDLSTTAEAAEKKSESQEPSS